MVRLPGITLAVLLGCLSGCTTTVIAPASPQNPTTVFLLDHGRTPSLVLPTDDGRMIRYAYGDWTWYALAKTGIWEGFAALFLPTQGALGRKALDGPCDADHVEQRVNVGIEQLYSIEVEADKVAALRGCLDATFEANRATLVVNEPYGLEFVHHPRKYTFLCNSNHAVAQWLRELGCETRGGALFSNWKVRHPE
jgi:hypothetical protein